MASDLTPGEVLTVALAQADEMNTGYVFEPTSIPGEYFAIKLGHRVEFYLVRPYGEYWKGQRCTCEFYLSHAEQDTCGHVESTRRRYPPPE